MRPHAMNIMLPVEPGDSIDQGNSGGSHPNGDETANNDGWAAFSGTSAAAPQLAGVAALIKQACNKLTPAEIRQIMMDTARDVTTGNCHPNHGHPATVGPDLATGHGLVDAHRASLMARLRCQTIGPIQPRGPVVPIQPRGPVTPIQPRGPVTPIQPRGPITPIQPRAPITPVQPIRPVRPIGPVVVNPENAEAPQSEQQWTADQATGMGLTEEELDTIEDMINKGQVDPDSI
jgi:hypothetical protein